MSPAEPSAASGEPDDAASDTCATSRACAASAASRAPGSASAGMPAASPLMPPSSASATGALTWSSDEIAASITRGQAARCAVRAASRSAAGA